jgi:transcriptional regulator with XRE-family HTH domain
MKAFSIRLRQRAKELGISHAEAARRAGLESRRYSNYLNGIREPDLPTFVRIAEALQTTPDDLLSFGSKRKTANARMLERLQTAAQALDDVALEILAVQAEALIVRPQPPRQRTIEIRRLDETSGRPYVSRIDCKTFKFAAVRRPAASLKQRKVLRQ